MLPFLQKPWQRKHEENKAMLANWGYQDGSGKYFICIDTDKCNGCGKCVEACPQAVLEVGEDPADPFRDEPVAFVAEVQRNKLKFACSPCKTYLTAKGKKEAGEHESEIMNAELKTLLCVAACEKEAISHSW